MDASTPSGTARPHDVQDATAPDGRPSFRRRLRGARRGIDLGRIGPRELLVAYAAHPTIAVYGVLCVGCAAVAALSCQAAVPTMAAVVATLALYPFVEYGLHRYVLHARFLYRHRLTAALWKRIHFDHHQDPHRLDVLFGALSNTLPMIAAITLPLGWAIAGVSGATAACATGLLAMAVYELCHAMQHLGYQPRSRFLRRIKQRHLAHHFHDETSNFGITSSLVDRICGTLARPPRTQRSPHVFDLGYDAGERRRYPWVAALSGRRRDAP